LHLLFFLAPCSLANPSMQVSSFKKKLCLVSFVSVSIHPSHGVCPSMRIERKPQFIITLKRAWVESKYENFFAGIIQVVQSILMALELEWAFMIFPQLGISPQVVLLVDQELEQVKVAMVIRRTESDDFEWKYHDSQFITWFWNWSCICFISWQWAGFSLAQELRTGRF
jgi:hypothetical protein